MPEYIALLPLSEPKANDLQKYSPRRWKGAAAVVTAIAEYVWHFPLLRTPVHCVSTLRLHWKRACRAWDFMMRRHDLRARMLTRLFSLAALIVDFAYVKIGVKLYNIVRNMFGSMRCEPSEAFNNAMRIVELERKLFIYWEERIQASVLHFTGYIQFWNTFYLVGMFHVVLVLLGYLFIQEPLSYQHNRNTFLMMNILALLGYAIFPVMPPRLIPACRNPYGVCQEDFAFIDTLYEFPNFLKKNTKRVSHTTNHFAAMHSMHVGYSFWAGYTIFKVCEGPFIKFLGLLYPIAMTYCTLVTANHFLLDCLAGIFTFYAAAKLQWLLPRVGRGAQSPQLLSS